MKTKSLLQFALFAALSFAADKPQISDLDKEKLRRIDVQMQLLQKQINESIAPILAEQNEIKARVCKDNKVELSECEINYLTGSVTKAKKEPEPKK